MSANIYLALQETFGEHAISESEIKSFEQLHECVLKADWLEYDDSGDVFFLSPEVLEYKPAPHEHQEALGLGELEDRIVDVLEQGKSIPWGKVAIAMWIFFLFIVVYTVLETISK